MGAEAPQRIEKEREKHVTLQPLMGGSFLACERESERGVSVDPNKSLRTALCRNIFRGERKNESINIFVLCKGSACYAT